MGTKEREELKKPFGQVGEKGSMAPSGEDSGEATGYEAVKRLAESGEIWAMRSLAEKLMTGDGGDWDPRAGFQWMQRAAIKEDDAEAKVAMARWLIEGQYNVPVDVNVGLTHLWGAMEQGKAEAIEMYSDLLWDGKVVERDTRQAFYWRLQLFEEGRLSPSGMRRLSDMLKIEALYQATPETQRPILEPTYVPLDLEESPQAIEQIATEWIEYAARNGDPAALNIMGHWKLNGSPYVMQDPDGATAYLYKAFESGDGYDKAYAARMMVRNFLNFGEDRENHVQEILAWIEALEACGEESWEERQALAVLADQSRTAQESDPPHPLEWEWAASDSRSVRDWLDLVRGDPEAGNPEAIAEEARADAIKGDPKAQNNLGGLYALGLGVPRNDVLAHAWANRSGENGSEAGERNRLELEKNMTPEDIQASWAKAMEA
ncbi:tetratricopeptide repeat protein [Thioalkalivibrio sp. ALE23]|uniref:tetratricopeptide repeat protein n=1 Tax=Thioalkalivibrio sp. ALE23 TaxID=1265495 RepID=UPI0003770E52|nr:SEL1-like repeat protein [Thioalkalivibrio sp. ALE23]